MKYKFIFEFTDNYIYYYDKFKRILYEEKIPNDIVVLNKIYDYIKLSKIINNVLNKQKLLNNMKKNIIGILLFEKISPAEQYLYKLLFNNITNIDVKFIYVSNYFDKKHIFISGNLVYYEQELLNYNLNAGEYILIGNGFDINKIKSDLLIRMKINILLYENSNTIIYEKV